MQDIHDIRSRRTALVEIMVFAGDLRTVKVRESAAAIILRKKSRKIALLFKQKNDMINFGLVNKRFPYDDKAGCMQCCNTWSQGARIYNVRKGECLGDVLSKGG